MGGVNGAFGMAVVGGASFASAALIVVGSLGGSGSDVAGLAEPGRTTGLESPILGFLLSVAYCLCQMYHD